MQRRDLSSEGRLGPTAPGRTRRSGLGTQLGVLALAVALSGGEVRAQPQVPVRDLPSYERVQTELPGRDEQPNTLGPKSVPTEPAAESERARIRDRSSDVLFVGTMILLGLIGTGTVFAWVRRARERRGGRNAGSDPSHSVPSPRRRPFKVPRPAAEPAQPELLAAEGRYTEAVHALWIRALRAAGADRLPRGLTSRQMIGRLPLEAAARRAMDDLRRRAEETWFGGTTASEEDWHRAQDLARIVGPSP